MKPRVRVRADTRVLGRGVPDIAVPGDLVVWGTDVFEVLCTGRYLHLHNVTTAITKKEWP